MMHSEETIKQYQDEVDDWKKRIVFIMEENTILKSRLSALIKSRKFDKDLLEAAEHFMNSFVTEDDTIQLMRRDVREHDKLLVRDLYEDGNLFKEVVSKHKKIRKEISAAEESFKKLKAEFSKYLDAEDTGA